MTRQSLRSLNLTLCYNINDEGIGHIMRCVALQTLVMRECPHVGDRAVALLGRESSLVRKCLTVVCSAAVMEAGVLKLLTLDLLGCQISDRGLQFFKLARTRTLERRREAAKLAEQQQQQQAAATAPRPSSSEVPSLAMTTASARSLLAPDAAATRPRADSAAGASTLKSFILGGSTRVTDAGVSVLAEVFAGLFM